MERDWGGIAIRQAEPEDLDLLVGLLRKLYEAHHTVEEIVEETRAFLTHPDQAFFLAFVEGEPAGVANVSFRREYVEGSRAAVCGYLEAIYTEEAYRRRGLAGSLMREVEAWSKGRGCTLLASDCQVDNERSFSFHLGLGFEEVSRNIHFIKSLEK